MTTELTQSCKIICDYYSKLLDKSTTFKFDNEEWIKFYTKAIEYISNIMNYCISQFDILKLSFNGPSKEDLAKKDKMYNIFIEFFKVFEQSKIEIEFYTTKNSNINTIEGYGIEMKILCCKMTSNSDDMSSKSNLMSSKSCINFECIKHLYDKFKAHVSLVDESINDPKKLIEDCKRLVSSLQTHIRNFPTVIKSSKYYRGTILPKNGGKIVKYEFSNLLDIESRDISLESLQDKTTKFFNKRDIPFIFQVLSLQPSQTPTTQRSNEPSSRQDDNDDVTENDLQLKAVPIKVVKKRVIKKKVGISDDENILENNKKRRTDDISEHHTGKVKKMKDLYKDENQDQIEENEYEIDDDVSYKLEDIDDRIGDDKWDLSALDDFIYDKNIFKHNENDNFEIDEIENNLESMEPMEPIGVNFKSNAALIGDKISLTIVNGDLIEVEGNENDIINWMSIKSNTIFKYIQSANEHTLLASQLADEVVINVYMNYFNPELAANNGFFDHYNAVNTKAVELLGSISIETNDYKKKADFVRRQGKNVRKRSNVMLDFALKNLDNDNENNSMSNHDIIFIELFKETLRIATERLQLNLLPIISATFHLDYTLIRASYPGRVMNSDKESLFRGINIPKSITQTSTVTKPSSNPAKHSLDEREDFGICVEEKNVVLGLTWDTQDASTKKSILNHCKSNNLKELKRTLLENANFLILKRCQSNRKKNDIIPKVVIKETRNLIAYMLKQMEFNEEDVHKAVFGKSLTETDFIDPMKCILPTSFPDDVADGMTSPDGEILARLQELFPYLDSYIFGILSEVSLLYFENENKRKLTTLIREAKYYNSCKNDNNQNSFSQLYVVIVVLLIEMSFLIFENKAKNKLKPKVHILSMLSLKSDVHPFTKDDNIKGNLQNYAALLLCFDNLPDKSDWNLHSHLFKLNNVGLYDDDFDIYMSPDLQFFQWNFPDEALVNFKRRKEIKRNIFESIVNGLAIKVFDIINPERKIMRANDNDNLNDYDSNNNNNLNDNSNNNDNHNDNNSNNNVNHNDNNNNNNEYLIESAGKEDTEHIDFSPYRNLNDNIENSQDNVYGADLNQEVNSYKCIRTVAFKGVDEFIVVHKPIAHSSPNFSQEIKSFYISNYPFEKLTGVYDIFETDLVEFNRERSSNASKNRIINTNGLTLLWDLNSQKSSTSCLEYINCSLVYPAFMSYVGFLSMFNENGIHENVFSLIAALVNIESVSKSINLLCLNVLVQKLELARNVFQVLQTKLQFTMRSRTVVLKPGKIGDSYVLNIFFIHGNNVKAFHINPSTDSGDDSWIEHVYHELKEIFTVYMPSFGEEPLQLQRMNAVNSTIHRLDIPNSVVKELSGVIVILHILSISAFLTENNQNEFMDCFGGESLDNEETSRINQYTNKVLLSDFNDPTLRAARKLLSYFLITGSLPRVN